MLTAERWVHILEHHEELASALEDILRGLSSPALRRQGLPAESLPMNVRIAGIDFDRVDYDRDADVLYLHVGDPGTAIDWDESEEGHALRYGTDGEIVGITIVNARRILEEDGEISITLPKQRVVAKDLGPVLAAA